MPRQVHLADTTSSFELQSATLSCRPSRSTAQAENVTRAEHCQNLTNHCRKVLVLVFQPRSIKKGALHGILLPVLLARCYSPARRVGGVSAAKGSVGLVDCGESDYIGRGGQLTCARSGAKSQLSKDQQGMESTMPHSTNWAIKQCTFS
mgnify:CR=1 FL=1